MKRVYTKKGAKQDAQIRQSFYYGDPQASAPVFRKPKFSASLAAGNRTCRAYRVFLEVSY